MRATDRRAYHHEDRHEHTHHAASRILSLVLEALPEVHSAVDFGCGVGTWLAALRGRGIEEVLGIDATWVDRRLLQIPESRVRRADLNEPIALDRRYDLAISLEVAEHLRPASASTFVASLVSAADFVLFSAAIPFQGGHMHINEQWPAYWASLFGSQGYDVLDFIRDVIWDDGDIPAWYRQNVLLFARRERIGEVRVRDVNSDKSGLPRALVHPDYFLTKMTEVQSLRGSGRLFLHAVRDWAKRWV
jgi:hypothetical protein